MSATEVRFGLRDAGTVVEMPRTGDLLDRAIDEAVRLHVTRPDPSPDVYARIAAATRLPSRPQRDSGLVRTWAIATSCFVAAVLMVDLVLRSGGATASQVGSAIPAQGSVFLVWLSSTGLARWINESESIVGYPGILFLHTFGLAIVVGLSVAIDLRVLGAAARMSIASMRPLFWYLWVGFWVNAVSGALLFVADAPRKVANPLFEIKLAFVAFGVLLMASIERQLVRLDSGAASHVRLRLMAVGSLLAWVAAIAAGRLIAYAF